MKRFLKFNRIVYYYFISDNCFFYFVIISAPDPYATISCEGRKVKTPVQKDSLNPQWNTGALFFVRRPQKSRLVVQVRITNKWSHLLLHHFIISRIDDGLEIFNLVYCHTFFCVVGLPQENYTYSISAPPSKKKKSCIFIVLLCSEAFVL